MRTIALLFLLCASAYGDTITTNVVDDITTKVSEFKSSKDGKTERIERVFRGKTEILQTWSRCNKQGVMVPTARSYLIGGDLVMIESDDDGDGVFKNISLYRPGTDDLEMFRREADGSVKPVSTQTLEATKKQEALIDEFNKKLFDKKGASEQDIGERLQKMQQKYLDLEKEKKDDNK